MKSTVSRHFRILVLVILAQSSLLMAQTSMDLSGTVSDQSGAVLPGVSVSVKNTDQGFERSTLTNERGFYLLAGLSPGNYEVRVELGGFRTEVRRNLRFEANSRPVLNFSMQVASLAETVNVSEEAPLIETSRSELQFIVDEKRVRDLPLNGRNFLGYTLLSGGVVQIGGGAGDISSVNISINGQPRRGLVILADGVNTQTREIRSLSGDLAGSTGTVSDEVVKEVQVISDNFTAEFGQTTAGIVSVATRSGTNEFHGSAFTFIRPGRLDARNALARVKSPFNRQQWGGYVGGPIIKDKTHFLSSYEGTNQDQRAVVTSILDPGIVNQPFNNWKLFDKIDHQINSTNSVDVRFNLVRNRNDFGGVGGLNTRERATLTTDNVYGIVASSTNVLSPRLVNEGRFSWTLNRFLGLQKGVERKFPPNFNTIGPAVVRAGVGNAGANSSTPGWLEETRWQWNDKLTWTHGAHSFKWGGEAQYMRRFVTFFLNFPGTYTFAAGTPFPFDPNNPATFPVQYTQGFGQSGLRFNEWTYAGFFQDSWKLLSNFTLNYGLRYDYETIMKDTQNFSPRLGFAWDTMKNQKLLIRGGAGVFFSTIETSLINRESNFGPRGVFNLDLRRGDPLFPIFPARFTELPAGARNVNDTIFIPIVRGLSERDFPLSVGEKFGALRVNPYSIQANFGIQTEVTRDIAVSIDYTFIHGLKIGRTRDLNAPPFFEVGPGRTRSRAQADAQRPFGVPSRVPGPLGLQAGGFRRILLQESSAQSWYNGVKLNVTKRFSQHFTVVGNYTFSKALNDADNFREGDSFPIDPNNLRLERGIAEVDRRHNFVANGIWELPLGFRLTGIFMAQSGSPFTGFTGFDANGDSGPRDRPGRLGKNTFRTTGFTNFDGSLAKMLRLTEGHSVELRWETFNLFNNVNIVRVNETAGLDPARQPRLLGPSNVFGGSTVAANARQFQIAVKWLF